MPPEVATNLAGRQTRRPEEERMDWNKLWADTRLAFRRMFTGDFQKEKATDEERQLLTEAKEPVKSAQAQDYAAWRRSLLWIAGVIIVVEGLLEAVTFTSMQEMLGDNEFTRAVGTDNLETIDGVFGFLIFPVLAGGVLALIAAIRWRDVRLSRRLARVGFLVMFLTPFALAAIPVKSLLEFPANLSEEQQMGLSYSVGLFVGLRIFMLLGPRAIALFPGVIRSAMTLKTLIPESPMPGWAAAVMAPLYSIFLLVVFALLNQVQGNFLLILALVSLMLAPLIYLWRWKRVMRPHRAEEVSASIGRVRRIWAILGGVGAFFFLVFFIDVELGFGNMLKFFLAVAGNIALLTVVGADFLLALLHHGHDQSKALVESKLDDLLEARFTALEDVGFTDLGTGDKVEETADDVEETS